MTHANRKSGSRPTAANRAALASVRSRARRTRARDVARIEGVLSRAGVAADVGELCAAVARAGVVTINFHPDRLLADGRSVAEAFNEEGVYRSQFESRISNGGLTAFPGGERDRWERELFGGAYHTPGAEDAVRPRYGGLNLLGFSNGACPRFGSCHLRLSPESLERSTFFFGDSAGTPEDGGVIDALQPVLAGLLECLAHHPEALGRPDVTVPDFVRWLLGARTPGGLFPPTVSRELDTYIEAQVHGSVDLAADVAALVIDPSFAGTATGDLLLAAADRHGFVVEWTTGLRLTVADVPTQDPDPAEPRRWRAFCAGGRAARLAEHVVTSYADDGTHVDAQTIGQAAASVVRDPGDWVQWGPPDCLTHLKDLWLILVAYGKPIGDPTHSAQPGG